jgi:hypothetical protein
MRLRIPTFLMALAALLTGSGASADYMITNLAASQSPLASDGGGTLTHIPASAEVQADENAGFENAFNFFVTRGFTGSLAEQFVNHDTIRFNRTNIPDATPNGFLNTFFVINTDAAPLSGYTVFGPPEFLDPNNAGSDEFVYDYSTQPNAVAALQNYNAGGGTFMVIHIVQQSDAPTSVRYGDLSLTGSPLIPEPATLAIVAPAIIGALSLLRRHR